MSNYRFTAKEVEDMKQNILVHIENENSENKTAWRLRCALEGLAYCVICSKKEKAKRIRRIALYDSLTKNDMPNFY